MKWITLVVSFLILLSTVCLFVGAVRSEEYVESYQQAKDLAFKEGKDVVEDSLIQDPSGAWVAVKVSCRMFQKAGLGDGGWWIFYTIKYYPSTNNVVIVIYKPEIGALIILRQDTYQEGVLYSVFMEQDHSLVVWGFTHSDEVIANGFVKVFLRPMESIFIGKWTFTPDEEMRRGDCWEIKPQEGSK